MNILVTGNRGYIGAVMTSLLLERGYRVIGLDTGYFNDCKFMEYSNNAKQINKDIRLISKEDLQNVDAVIHLAALSNDPLGELSPELTCSINHEATVKLAEAAKKSGVNRFLYASSCSLYGKAGDVVNEQSELAPATAYALSKVMSEKSLSEMAGKNFSPVMLRLSTAYGLSPQLRCDVVLNNLAGWAFTTGIIRIMSDGTPWRPLIHVEDFSNAFIACLEAQSELVHNEVFNVGRDDENYQVKDIAEAVKKASGCNVEYTNEHGADTRSYKVDFGKIKVRIKNFKPKWNIEKGALELCSAYKKNGLTKENFLGKYTRLSHIKRLIAEKRVDERLFWL